MSVPRHAFRHALKALYDWLDDNAFNSYGLIPSKNNYVLVHGGSQGNATVLTAKWNEIKSCNADGTDAAQLPHALPGMDMWIINNDGFHDFTLFTTAPDILNPVSNNPSATPFTIGGNSAYHFACMTEGEWNNL